MRENVIPVWIANLFKRFQAIWSHKFTSAYPTELILNLALAQWASGLSGFSSSILKKALDEAALTLEFPPTLKEFWDLCSKHKKNDSNAFYVAKDETLSRSTPESTVIANEARAKIWAALGRPDKFKPKEDV